MPDYPNNIQSNKDPLDGPSKSDRLLHLASHRYVFYGICILVLLISIIGTILHEKELNQVVADIRKHPVTQPSDTSGLFELALQSIHGSKWVTALHLALPVSVLGLELYMLVRMVVESRERRALETNLASFKTLFGRDLYLLEITASIRAARQKILFTTFSMEHSQRNKGQQEILQALKDRLKDKSQYQHLGVIAKRPEALPGTFELLFAAHKSISHEAETKPQFSVRMSFVLSQTRLRFFTRDGEYCIIGLSEGAPGLFDIRPTTRCYAVDSTMLADALGMKFQTLWDAGQCPWEYLGELIAESCKSQQTYSQDDVLRELGANTTDAEFRNFIAAGCAAFKALPDSRP